MHASANDADEDGFILPVCTCGWKYGPVPDEETATDALMDHAFYEGAQAYAKARDE